MFDTKEVAPMTEFTPVESTSSDVVLSVAKVELQALQSGSSPMHSTMPLDTFDEKRAALSALNNAVSLDDADMVGKPFNLVHFIAHEVSIGQPDGTSVDANRVILITDTGDAYAAVSSGIVSSLRRVTGLFGPPATWPEPLPVQVNQRKTRNGFKVLTLDVI